MGKNFEKVKGPHAVIWSHDSSVGIETRLRAAYGCVEFPAEARDFFFFSTSSRLALEPLSLLYSGQPRPGDEVTRA
jgi:hypothetical protein